MLTFETYIYVQRKQIFDELNIAYIIDFDRNVKFDWFRISFVVTNEILLKRPTSSWTKCICLNKLNFFLGAISATRMFDALTVLPIDFDDTSVLT